MLPFLPFSKKTSNWSGCRFVGFRNPALSAVWRHPMKIAPKSAVPRIPISKVPSGGTRSTIGFRRTAPSFYPLIWFARMQKIWPKRGGSPRKKKSFSEWDNGFFGSPRLPSLTWKVAIESCFRSEPSVSSLEVEYRKQHSPPRGPAVPGLGGFFRCHDNGKWG